MTAMNEDSHLKDKNGENHELIETAQQFISWVFAKDFSRAMALCEENVVFVGMRPTPSEQVSIYGAHHGAAGALYFFEQLFELIEAGEFNIEHTLADSTHVMMYGNFHHHIKTTRQPFLSDWALVIKFSDAGKIAMYHMYEDTAALEQAMQIH